jgi:hypothetical protein
MTALNHDFNGTSPAVAQEFLSSLQVTADLTVEASPSVATHIVSVDGLPHIFFANFKGLVGGSNPVQSRETDARIVISGLARVYFLPFLGDVEELKGTSGEGKTTFLIPPINKGAVVWLKVNGRATNGS